MNLKDFNAAVAALDTIDAEQRKEITRLAAEVSDEKRDAILSELQSADTVIAEAAAQQLAHYKEGEKTLHAMQHDVRVGEEKGERAADESAAEAMLDQ
jgi:hypothetical protein